MACSGSDDNLQHVLSEEEKEEEEHTEGDMVRYYQPTLVGFTLQNERVFSADLEEIEASIKRGDDYYTGLLQSNQHWFRLDICCLEVEDLNRLTDVLSHTSQFARLSSPFLREVYLSGETSSALLRLLCNNFGNQRPISDTVERLIIEHLTLETTGSFSAEGVAAFINLFPALKGVVIRNSLDFRMKWHGQDMDARNRLIETWTSILDHLALPGLQIIEFDFGKSYIPSTLAEAISRFLSKRLLSWIAIKMSQPSEDDTDQDRAEFGNALGGLQKIVESINIASGSTVQFTASEILFACLRLYSRKSVVKSILSKFCLDNRPVLNAQLTVSIMLDDSYSKVLTHSSPVSIVMDDVPDWSLFIAKLQIEIFHFKDAFITLGIDRVSENFVAAGNQDSSAVQIAPLFDWSTAPSRAPAMLIVSFKNLQVELADTLALSHIFPVIAARTIGNAPVGYPHFHCQIASLTQKGYMGQGRGAAGVFCRLQGGKWSPFYYQV